MQLLRPLFVFALLGLGLIYWLGVHFAGPVGGYIAGAGALGGLLLFWLMLGLGFGYWFGIDGAADKMVSRLMDWKRDRKASARRPQTPS